MLKSTFSELVTKTRRPLERKILTSRRWNYLKVPQKDLAQLQPTDFADLLAL